MSAGMATGVLTFPIGDLGRLPASDPPSSLGVRDSTRTGSKCVEKEWEEPSFSRPLSGDERPSTPLWIVPDEVREGLPLPPPRFGDCGGEMKRRGLRDRLRVLEGEEGRVGPIGDLGGSGMVTDGRCCWAGVMLGLLPE